VERPAVQALKLWPTVGTLGFPYKASHLLMVWRQNGGENNYFPDLADRLLEALHLDFSRLPEEQRQKQLPFWEGLFGGLQARLGTSSILLLLKDPLLCHRLAPQLDETRILAALVDGNLDSNELIVSMETMVKHHLQGKALFGKLVKLLWGRFLRACSAREEAKIRQALTMLVACFEFDAPAFRQQSTGVIQSRMLGFALPYLKEFPFVVACLKDWKAAVGTTATIQSGGVVLVQLRLAACLKAVYGPPDAWPESFAPFRKVVGENWLMTYYYG